MSENIIARITKHGDLLVKGDIIISPDSNVSFSKNGDLKLSNIEQLSEVNGLFSVDYSGTVIKIRGNAISGVSFDGSEPIFPTEPILDDLFLYYDFRNKSNQDANRSIIEDLSGNGNNGNLTNFAFEGVSGYTSEGLSFDGIDDIIISKDSTETLSTSTLLFNFIPNRLGDASADYFPSVVSNFSIDPSMGHSPMIFSNRIGVDMGINGEAFGQSYEFFIAENAIKLNERTIIAVSYDGVKFCLYVNGIMHSCQEIDYVKGLKKFIIGRWAHNYSDYLLDGVVSSVQVYDRALTDMEILRNYNYEIGRDL